jgi:hypothetical protein
MLALDVLGGVASAVHHVFKLFVNDAMLRTVVPLQIQRVIRLTICSLVVPSRKCGIIFELGVGLLSLTTRRAVRVLHLCIGMGMTGTWSSTSFGHIF